MIKLSGGRNSNRPSLFKANCYKPKGQLIKDLRILERTIEERDQEIADLKEKIKAFEAKLASLEVTEKEEVTSIVKQSE